MFPNRIDEITKRDFEILESIEMSNVSMRSAMGRRPFRELNPYSRISNSPMGNWSPMASEAFKGKNDSIKIISVRYLGKVKLDDGSITEQLISQKFNQNAGDVKDLYNLLYGYDLNSPEMKIINQTYIDFMVGSPLPSVYLQNLLKKLDLCPLMEKHLRTGCLTFHPEPL